MEGMNARGPERPFVSRALDGRCQPYNTLAFKVAGLPRAELGLISKAARKLEEVGASVRFDWCECLPGPSAGRKHRDLFSQDMPDPRSLPMAMSDFVSYSTSG